MDNNIEPILTHDPDLESGIPQQKSGLTITPAIYEDRKNTTASVPTASKDSHIAEASKFSSAVAAKFDFDKDGNRSVHEQHQHDHSSPHSSKPVTEGPLPSSYIRIILRKLDPRDFDDGSPMKKVGAGFHTGFRIAQKMHDDGSTESEFKEEAQAFVGRILLGKSNRVSSPIAYRIWELFRLWTKDDDGWFWMDDPIFKDIELEMAIMNNPQLFRRSHILYLTAQGSPFLILPSIMKIDNASEEHLQVECRFWGLRHNPDDSYSRNDLFATDFPPLYTEFKRVLESELSAIALFNGDTQLGAKLASLDILRASIECWSRFLLSVRQQSSGEDFTPDHFQLQHDLQHIMRFSRTVRDIAQATEATLASIEDLPDANSDRQHRYRKISFELQWKLSAIKHVMEDIKANHDNLRNVLSSARNIAQESSLKRLTIFASAFLPISLASSLLSMSTRAATLGALWYDFFGISVIIGFVIFAMYQVSRKLGRIWEGEGEAKILRQVRTFIWRSQKMNDHVDFEKREKGRRQKVADGNLTIEEAQRESHEDKEQMKSTEEKQDKFHLWFKVVTSTANSTFHILWMVATVSFLVGIFKDIATGLSVLKYGVAGSVSYGIVVILPWRILSDIVIGDRLD